MDNLHDGLPESTVYKSKLYMLWHHFKICPNKIYSPIAPIESDIKTWKDVIGRHENPAFHDGWYLLQKGWYLLLLCCLKM